MKLKMNTIAKNSTSNVARVIILTPIYFLLVPYIISKIGIEGYGIWALIGIFGSYRVFADFGMTTSLIKFIAEANEEKNELITSKYINTSIVTQLGFSIIPIIAIIIFRTFIIINVLNISENIEEIKLLVLIVAISTLINMLAGLFQAIIDGVQRMDISNITITIHTFISALGTYILLELEYGILGLGIIQLVMALVLLGTNIILSKRLIKFRINLFLFSKQTFKEIFSYSINIQLSSLARMWIEPGIKIIVSHMFSVTYVGYYEIALKFTSRITSLIRSALMPLFPAASVFYKNGGVARVEKLRYYSSKYLFLLVSGFIAVTFATLPKFILVWIGPDYNVVLILIMIQLVGLYASILATPAYVIMRGAGFARNTLHIELQTIIIQLICIPIFSSIFGFYGFAISFSLSMICSYYLSLYNFRKVFCLKELSRDSKFTIKAIAISLATYTMGMFVAGYINNTDLIDFILIGFVSSTLYLILIYYSKAIKKEDIRLIFNG